MQAGSGSSWRAPQDVVAPEYLESLKFTDKHTFILDADDLLRLREDAFRLGREPKMVIEFAQYRFCVAVTFDAR